MTMKLRANIPADAEKVYGLSDPDTPVGEMDLSKRSMNVVNSMGLMTLQALPTVPPQVLVGRHTWAPLYRADCLDILPALQPGLTYLTDQPYGTGWVQVAPHHLALLAGSHSLQRRKLRSHLT